MADYDWGLYLGFASNILSSSGFDEATVARVATSRAYYAAFHVAENYLLTRGLELGYQSSNTHDRVCDGFKKMSQGSRQFQATCRSIGNMLINLKKERVKADYWATVSFGKNVAKKNCAQAQKIIREISELGTGS